MGDIEDSETAPIFENDLSTKVPLTICSLHCRLKRPQLTLTELIFFAAILSTCQCVCAIGIIFMPSISIEKLDYPFGLVAHATDEQLTIGLKYDGDLINAKQIKRLIKQLQLILKQLPENINNTHNSISLLDKAEYDLIVRQWNQTNAPYPEDKTIHQLFEEQVVR